MLAASVCDMSSATIHSAIRQPCQVLKQYHQLVHGLNSLLVWFQRRVWSADGIVCDDITPCPIGSKMVGLGGGYFHLLQAPFGAAVAKNHRPCARSWYGIAAGVAQVPNWSLPSQKWQRCQCNASMMHCTLNSLINTINYNYF